MNCFIVMIGIYKYNELNGKIEVEEATDFANVLNAGKLPVRLRILTEETVLPMSSR